MSGEWQEGIHALWALVTAPSLITFLVMVIGAVLASVASERGQK